MKCDNPKISVIMPTFNADLYLKKAIDSILNQTFEDFEFIIINDGSTDDTKNIIDSYNDKRIKVINNNSNIGLSDSLNIGKDLALGEYIARQDADDISELNRFFLQIRYLEKNNLDLVDSNIVFIDEKDNYLEDYAYRKYSPNETFSHLFFYEIVHESIMCKRSLFNKCGIKYCNRPAEDYDLFIRFAKLGMKSGYIDKPLVKVRRHTSSLCGRNWNNIKKDIDNMRIDLLKEIGLEPKSYEKKMHIALVDQNISTLIQYQIKDLISWCRKILESNREYDIFNETYFKKELYLRLIKTIKSNKSKTINDIFVLWKHLDIFEKKLSFKDLFYLYKF